MKVEDPTSLIVILLGVGIPVIIILLATLTPIGDWLVNP